jgi:hypothetical protein
MDSMNIIVVIGALLTAFAAWIAVQQMRISKMQVDISRRQQAIAEEQNRHYLLERRHRFYDSMMRFVFEIQAYGRLREESAGWLFLHQKRQAAMLFDEDAQVRADEILRKYTELTALSAGGGDSEAHINWFRRAYFQDLPSHFESYLR